MTVTREEIITHARTMIGIPFVRQGRTRSGLDCIGFGILIAKELNLIDKTYDYTRYGIGFDSQIFMDELNAVLQKKPIKQRDIADFLVFSLPYYPCHLAMQSDVNSIIHAFNKVKKVTENHMDRYWINHLVACYQIPGVS